MGQQNRYGFIGVGNLANSVIGGLLSQGNIIPENLYIYDKDESKTQHLLHTGVRVLNSAVEVSEVCDYIFLTVKPNVYPTVLNEIKPCIQDQCIVTVAAGITTDYVKSILGSHARVVRVMPNTPLLVGKGASGLVHKPPVTPEQFETVFQVFSCAGYAARVEEEHIDAVTAISGSAPAYFFRLAALAVRFAAEQGMDPDIALSLIAKTMEGSSKMLLESGDSPEVLIRKVSSPGGTTVAALSKFDELGLDRAFTEGLYACMKRAGELSGEKD